MLTKYLRNSFSSCKHFPCGTDCINLLNKALFQELMQGSPSVLPGLNAQPKLMKGGQVHRSPLPGVRGCATVFGVTEEGHLLVARVPIFLDFWNAGYSDSYMFNRASCGAIFEATSKCTERGSIPNVVEPLHLPLNLGEQRSGPSSLITRYFAPKVRPELSQLTVCSDKTVCKNQR